MKRAYRAEDIRRVEAQYISEGVPLMERAAHAIALRTLEILKMQRGAYGSRVLLLVGVGDNGGDALFAGALLLARGVQVEAFALAEKCHPAGSAEFNRRGGGWVAGIDHRYDLVIDGYLGLGARAGVALDVVNQLMPLSMMPMLSIDLPSGINADGEGVHMPALVPDHTLAIGCWKVAHLLLEAGLGECELAEIDVAFENLTPALVAFEDEDVQGLLPIENSASHKYRRGTLGVIAGSDTYPGAGILTLRAALAMGIGMVRSYNIRLSEQYFVEVPEVVSAPGKIDALVVGPGVDSLSTEECAVVLNHLESGGIALLDAGAISFLAHIPQEHRGQVLITPHHGEFAAHFPLHAEKLESDSLECALQFVQEYGCHLLLKGPRTLILSPDEVPVVNMRGSAALATAGSGDVLAGVIGNLMARTGSVRDSAVAGAYIHGKAGERLTAGASELIELLPFALR